MHLLEFRLLFGFDLPTQILGPFSSELVNNLSVEIRIYLFITFSFFYLLY